MTSTISTTARRIAKAHNQCGGNLAGGFLAFDAEGRGGEWYSRDARPDAAILFPVKPWRLTQRDVQYWLDDHA